MLYLLVDSIFGYACAGFDGTYLLGSLSIFMSITCSAYALLRCAITPGSWFTRSITSVEK